MNILLKSKYSFISTLVFFIAANPELYKLTSWLFGPWVASPTTGEPKPWGLVLHSFIFFSALLGLMVIP